MEVNRLFPVKKNPKVQTFGPGDTVRVHVRVKEGDRERVQAFQGVVMETHGKAPGTVFTVRRVTYGIGVERVFPMYSPGLEAVEVIRRGDVRRANLSYLRGRFGRAARIKEKAWSAAQVEEQPPEETVAAAEAPAAEAPATRAEAAAPAAPAPVPASQPEAKSAQPAPESAEPNAPTPQVEAKPADQGETKQQSA